MSSAYLPGSIQYTHGACIYLLPIPAAVISVVLHNPVYNNYCLSKKYIGLDEELIVFIESLQVQWYAVKIRELPKTVLLIRLNAFKNKFSFMSEA